MYAFFIVTFYSFVIQSSSFISQIRLLILIISGLFGYFIYFLHHYKEMSSLKIFAFIMMMIFFWLVSSTLRLIGIYDFDVFKYTLFYMGIALNLLDHKHSINITRFMFYCVCFIIIYKIVIMNVPIRMFMKDGTSYNYISVITLFFLLLYCLVYMQHQKKIPITTALIFFIICLLSYGRGGIVTASFFLISIISYNYIMVNGVNKKIVIFILLAFSLLFMFEPLLTKIYELGFLNKFLSAGYSDASRFYIWDDYLSSCFESAKSFLLGGNKYGVMPDGNLHNSYLQLYSSFGFIPFLVNIYIFINLILLTFRNKNGLYLIILFTFFIRSFTDKLLFQGYCEIFYFYFIFDYLKNSNKITKNIKYKKSKKVFRRL